MKIRFSDRAWIGFEIFAVVLFLICCWNVPSMAQKTEHVKTFLDAVEDYRQGDFEKSAEAFNRIAEAGVGNGKLFYNLGNAYLKTEQLGKAILWYERALEIIPNDPDLRFNLDYARTLVKDQPEDKASALFTVLFFWRDMMGPHLIRWGAVVSNLIFWTVLAIGLVLKRRPGRGPAAKLFLSFSLAAAIVFTSTAVYDFYARKSIRHGIIIADEVSVRSGLTEDSTELFVLHAGTKVRIERRERDHFRIYFSDDKIGWLKKSDAAII